MRGMDDSIILIVGIDRDRGIEKTVVRRLIEIIY